VSDIRLSRGLDLWQVIARGAGVIVFAIVFVLLGDIVLAAGSLTPVVFLLALLLLLLNLMGYVELALSAPRSGSAYVQVQQAEGGALGFFTGWCLLLSGLGLCALLVHGFGAQVAVLIEDHLGLGLPSWPWAVGLVLLVAFSNAVGTRNGRRGLVTVLILLLAFLLGFTLLALPEFKFDGYGGGSQNWTEALTLVTASFVGLEITASLQNEMRRREQGVPRAVFWTPVLAAVFGAVISTVAIGVVRPELPADSQSVLALFGDTVAGGAGRPLILAVGALALALALNGAFVLVVRLFYVMGKDGYWPAGFLRMHPRSGTPIWIIGLVGAILVPLSAVPVQFLSRVTGFLYLVVLMGVNLALVLREQPDTAVFKLPFHPWVPGLALAVDVLISPLWGMTYLAWAAGCLGIGALLYLAYARGHQVEAQEGVIVFKPPAVEEARVGYRVLVPIANPATAGNLLRLAGVLAREQGGEVVALQVVTVPEQIPLEEGRHRAAVGRVLLERAMAQAKEEGFAIQTMTRVAHSVAEGVLETSRDQKVDLILMGWGGYTRLGGASMGPIIDAVARNAACDLAVIKSEERDEIGKILVPTAGGPHTHLAARLAMMLSKAYNAEVTALYVQSGRASVQQMEENKQRIAQVLDGLPFSRPPEQKVVVADDVVDGIVEEAKGYDLVVLGASEERLLDQFIFGSIPQQIAARVSKTVTIARRYGGPTEFWTRKLARSLFGLFPRLSVEEQLELREAMSEAARPGANFFVLIVLSSVIATLGLLLSSAAVVIGAMLVAPLMSPILGFSLGIVLGDIRLTRLSIEAMFEGVASALVIAVLIAMMSPIKGLTEEIMMRTQPTLLDLVIAMASGMAGAYALSREEVGAALPGVAIAAALMPPLSVTGIGLALGEPEVAGGAFLLFVANIAAISLAGVLVFIVLGVRPQTWQPETQRRIRQGLIGFVLLMLVIAVPLGIIMAGIVEQTDTRNQIREVLTRRLMTREVELVEFEHRIVEERLTVVATVRSIETIDESMVNDVAEALREQLNRPVTLEVVTLPVIRSQD